MILEDLYNCDKKYGIIYTDPPWPQSKSNKRKCRPNQGKELDYPTMSFDGIKQIHKIFLDGNAASQHDVFMWTIDKFLPQTENMMRDLGYTLHARLIWDKCNGIAPAFTVRFAHEYLLWFYKKGQILMPIQDLRGKYTTVLREPSTKHSKKPLCAYQMIENMFPKSRKIELFARDQRDGWDSWGNELKILEEKTNERNFV